MLFFASNSPPKLSILKLHIGQLLMIAFAPAFRADSTILSTQERVWSGFFIERYDPINNRTLRSKSIKKRPDFRDERLPIPGTVIVKNYKGQKLEVKVLEKGFEYSNKIYKTLTALAQEITGSHWSGYEFFNI